MAKINWGGLLSDCQWYSYYAVL